MLRGGNEVNLELGIRHESTSWDFGKADCFSEAESGLC